MPSVHLCVLEIRMSAFVQEIGTRPNAWVMSTAITALGASARTALWNGSQSMR